uniref:Uncharacterized protein n=1 Tax=Arion vulgaris TaxID=1028688 RepID=A0A0B6ZFL4_9EUPU
MTRLYTPGHDKVQGNKSANFLANNVLTSWQKYVINVYLCDRGESQKQNRLREL